MGAPMLGVLEVRMNDNFFVFIGKALKRLNGAEACLPKLTYIEMSYSDAPDEILSTREL